MKSESVTIESSDGKFMVRLIDWLNAQPVAENSTVIRLNNAQPRVPADLEGIRERAEKATPGRLTIRGAWNGIVANESGSQVASFVMTPDAELFAHARADILSLLSRITALESRGGA